MWSRGHEITRCSQVSISRQAELENTQGCSSKSQSHGTIHWHLGLAFSQLFALLLPCSPHKNDWQRVQVDSEIRPAKVPKVPNVPDVPGFAPTECLIGLPQAILQWSANDTLSDGANGKPCVSQTPPGTKQLQPILGQ